jgi:hypothetical protein
MIAFSQALRAALPFIPHARRKAQLAALSSDLNALFAEAEGRWYDVVTGVLKPATVFNKATDLNKRAAAAVDRYFGKLALPRDQKLLEQAKHDAVIYFKQFYGVEPLAGA